MKKELERNNNLHPNPPSKFRGNSDVPKLAGHCKLECWLNKSMKIEMTDGRTLIGTFLCTDRDCNVILGSCSEYLCADEGTEEEPRVLGLAMIPGHHIVSICLDIIDNVKTNIL